MSIFTKTNTASRRDLIVNGSISKAILMLSTPTMLMGIIQSMIPVIDGLFINNVVGTAAASAITYCTPIIMLMTALAQGLSVAGTAMIGQMNGRSDFSGGKKVATQIFVATFFIGCLFAPILAGLSFPISNLTSSDISHNVFLYLILYSVIQPFSFLEFVYNAIKNANGKPEAPFIRMIILLILKVLFNFVFIVLLNWQIIGSVAATFFANILVCGWMYIELFISKNDDRLTLKNFHFDKRVIIQMFRIGIPAMLSTCMLNLGFFLINNETAKYGAVTLNGQGIANNITAICFTLPASFGTSVTTIVSMNVGAGNGVRAKKGCIVGCIISAISAALLIAIIVPLSPYLTILFTRQPDVLDVANKALHIYTYSVIGFGVCMVELGAFIGLGRTFVPMVVNILRVCVIRIIFIFFTEKYLGVYSVFWGNLVSNYLSAIISTVLLMRVPWVSTIKNSFVKNDELKGTKKSLLES